jgi:hypothetical protein
MCDHLYDTTTRYDAARKLLTFLLVCPVCRIEQVVETLEYAPNFAPTPAAKLTRRVRGVEAAS